MPTSTDWNALAVSIRSIAEKTDAQLAGRVSSLCRLTDAEIHKILPTQGDVASYAKLMAIVHDSTDEMVRAQQLKNNIGQLASVIVKVLGSIT